MAWHPIHESLLLSGGYNGSLIYWLAGQNQVSVWCGLSQTWLCHFSNCVWRYFQFVASIQPCGRASLHVARLSPCLIAACVEIPNSKFLRAHAHCELVVCAGNCTTIIFCGVWIIHCGDCYIT
jgi:hypothetical protein